MDGGNIAGRWRGVGGDDGNDLLQFPVPVECQNGVSGPEMEFRDGGGVLDGFWRLRLPVSLIRPKRIYFPKHFCYCFASNFCILDTTNTD